MALDINTQYEDLDRTIRANLANQLAMTAYGSRVGPIIEEIDIDDVIVKYDFLLDQFGLRKLKSNLPKKAMLKKSVQIGSDEYTDDITIPLRKSKTTFGPEYMLKARTMPRQIPNFIDTKVSGLIASTGEAFSSSSFDDKPYFDKTHPRFSAGDTQSNLDDGGGGDYWYLFDTRIMGPVIWQWLQRPELEVFGPETEYARRERELSWDLHLDAGWGMGLWYYGYASNQTLNEEKLQEAISAMQAVLHDAKTDGSDQVMGITPTTLVVGRSNEWAARKLLNQAALANGEDNIMRASLNLVALTHLA